MNRIAVLVVRDSSPIRFAGLDLADRAARVARRAGAETVQTVDDNQPFASAPPAELLLVLPERVVVEPGLLADLMRRSLVGLEDAAVVVDAEGKSTDILLLSRDAVKRIRFAPRVRLGLRQLAAKRWSASSSRARAFASACVTLATWPASRSSTSAPRTAATGKASSRGTSAGSRFP
jgi:hypothetical protein